MKKIIPFMIAAAFFTFSCNKSAEQSLQTKSRKLSVQEYQEAVYASWLGQIVGNTYGLCYEFQYLENPGPDTFPYGFTWTLDSLKKYNGAFSDDDTDIEYLYLNQMEKHGIEPTYAQLTEAWKTHVTNRVWCANRQAVTLMHAGHYPPLTGSVLFNPQWCQIDPQLVNEIWAVTAPGMVPYAVEKTRYAARITSDSFGLEPALHYAAMYSAAFFEKDINTLIDLGTAALPRDARFAKIVAEVRELYSLYPNDWKTSRKIIKDRYYLQQAYNKHCWPVIDANLNGAYGIMALLYGQGDFQKTLDYCCAFGMDADNQAATMCGLLALAKGIDCIPQHLLFPLKESTWKEPYNNSYKMITRPGLKDATLRGIAARMAAQGEKIILAKGGKIEQQGSQKFYLIPNAATFTPPFELNPIPDLVLEVNQPFSYPLYAGANPDSIRWSTKETLPDGLRIRTNTLVGTPKTSGKFRVTLQAKLGNEIKSIQVRGTIHEPNLAPKASQILFNPSAVDHHVEYLRDGKTDKTYYSIKKGPQRETDYYGYQWDEEQTISTLLFNVGVPQEYCGWFTSLEVEYLDGGQWKKIVRPTITPAINLENTQWLKPSFMEHAISFPPVKTKAVRIIGNSGGLPKDATNAHLGLQYYTAISELKAYAD